MTNDIVKALRQWAADAESGDSVELGAETLNHLADLLDHTQCGGAAQTVLALLGDAESVNVSRGYILSICQEQQLDKGRLRAQESHIASLERESAGLHGELNHFRNERRVAA